MAEKTENVPRRVITHRYSTINTPVKIKLVRFRNTRSLRLCITLTNSHVYPAWLGIMVLLDTIFLWEMKGGSPKSTTAKTLPAIVTINNEGNQLSPKRDLTDSTVSMVGDADQRLGGREGAKGRYTEDGRGDTKNSQQGFDRWYSPICSGCSRAGLWK